MEFCHASGNTKLLRMTVPTIDLLCVFVVGVEIDFHPRFKKHLMRELAGLAPLGPSRFDMEANSAAPFMQFIPAVPIRFCHYCFDAEPDLLSAIGPLEKNTSVFRSLSIE